MVSFKCSAAFFLLNRTKQQKDHEFAVFLVPRKTMACSRIFEEEVSFRDKYSRKNVGIQIQNYFEICDFAWSF
jgi:hypothetical protein